MKGKRIALLWLLPFALFYIAFQLAPLIWVAGNSFWSDVNSRWGVDNYHDILTSPFYLQAIRFLSISLSGPVCMGYLSRWWQGIPCINWVMAVSIVL